MHQKNFISCTVADDRTDNKRRQRLARRDGGGPGGKFSQSMHIDIFLIDEFLYL